MIVDTHVHVVAADQQKYPRKISLSFNQWVMDRTGEAHLELMREAGIDRTLLVQAFSAYGYDNNYTADCAAKYPDRFAGVCIVDPTQKDAPERLTYWVKERGIRGIRIFPMTEPVGEWLDDPATFPTWERAAALGIPACVCAPFKEVSKLRAPLERFPNLPVALDHVGFPPTADGAPYKAAEPALQLARFPNFYLKFSTENLYAAVKGKSTAKDFFRCLLDRFGAKRMMWGSNFPATFDRGLKEQLELALNELSFVSEEERRWLFSETALTLWPMLR
jgi:L-fuconolactonase